MARVARPDGVQIHWEARGEGPLVIVARGLAMHPASVEPLIGELPDHRVVQFHDRGTGDSTRRGPYDMDTAADDLTAVIEAAGDEAAVIVTTGDGCNRAVRVAARRPDLVRAVVTVGGAPLPRPDMTSSDAMISSTIVVEAFLDMAATDYRAALRSLMAATNPQLADDALRERVAMQVEHMPRETAVPRLRAWAADDASEPARLAGDRLWFLVAPGLGGGWFPEGSDYERIVRQALPEARLEWVDDGIISRPDQTAAVVRRITAQVRQSA